MAKKGSRLREFEKNNRVLDISAAQEARKKKKEKKNGKHAVEDILSETTSAASVAAAAGKEKARKPNMMKLVSIVVSLIFIAIVLASVKNIFDLKEEENKLKEKKVELTQIKEELTIELENVNSDEYIEEQARKELKLVKGNELIFYFPEDWELERGEDKEEGENE